MKKHEDFVNELKLKNKELYDNIVFVDKYAGSHVKIIVKYKYGYIYITPSNILFGKIPTISSAINKNEYFANMAIEVHGNVYSYDKVSYINGCKKVIITCGIHGDFSQTPGSHLSGHGCPSCKKKTLNVDSKCVNYYSYHDKLSKIGILCHLVNGDTLSVSCHKCGKVYSPKKENVVRKIASANGKRNGENNLYCSDECKDSCPTFGHKSSSIDPRSILYVASLNRNVARSCQNKSLKQLQCDSHGYNYCERCGDIIDVELHHTLEISKFKKEAIDSSGHILLCAGCHTFLHNECKLGI